MARKGEPRQDLPAETGPTQIGKQHLREKYEDDLALVEEFIQEIEGNGKNRDITRWSQFTYASQNEAEMLKRLVVAFEIWLNP